MNTELSDYLEQNEGMPSDDLHGELIEDIIVSLHRMEIQDQYKPHREVWLFRGDKPYGVADLVIEAVNELYVIEATTINATIDYTGKRRAAIRKLNKQLRRDSDFFSSRFPVKPIKFGVLRYNNSKEFYFYELGRDANCRRVDPIRAVAHIAQG